jgi:3',5'-cyclic AMP phosphodiesterase CpdA
MFLCQISDLHIKAPGKLAYGVVDTALMLQHCVARILALPQAPDLVLATGDLVDGGRADEYARLRELLAPLPMPWYLMPGNHDAREPLLEVFPDHRYLRQMDGFLQFVIDAHPLRVVALDTLVPGAAGGALCPRRLAWLEHALAQSTRPTVVALHHPPFMTGIAHMDRLGLERDSIAALARVIGDHPQVERVIAGHLHRPIHTRFAGTIASTCPSPAHQVALDLADDATGAFVLEPPAFQMHLWSAGRLVTHTVYVDDFPGPYPFRGDLPGPYGFPTGR